MARHPDLDAEQAFVDHAYARIDAVRDLVSGALKEAYAHERGGTHQARIERDVIVSRSLARLEQLQLGQEALCFGRIDTLAADAFHIGRLAVSDDDGEPLVVDWRAPVCEPFYRATGAHPMGLARRRHFLTDGRTIVDIEDELFGGDGAGLGVGGSAALLAALERSRSGRMRDIVATVQREQDEIIRAPLAGILVVQGGPGTGKTAVALHRAAYLLYTHRFPLESQGVLVVGPNPVFLRYIEHVLPSLGESGVEMATIHSLVHSVLPDVKAGGADTPFAARVKGDARMGRVIARAVGDRQRPLRHDLVLGFGAHRLTLGAAETAHIVQLAKRRPGAHNTRRRFVELLVARRFLALLHAADERGRELGMRPSAPPPGLGDVDDHADIAAPAEEFSEQDMVRLIRSDEEIVRALDRMWPVLTPPELLHDLFGALPLLKSAARNVLADDEVAALARARSESADVVAWTLADLALLDEAEVVLGHVKVRRRRMGGAANGNHDEDGGLRQFGHIVVDEAQDLTPMQLRMLARRSISGSMTIVGDLAQGTGPWAPGSWLASLAHLPGSGRDERTRQVELSVNYRTPAEIMEVAGRVLAVAAPNLKLPESVRATGSAPAFVAVPADSLARTAAATAASELEAVADSYDEGGTVVVIVPGSLLGAVRSALQEAEIAFGEQGRTALDASITLLPAEVVKGLEFDSVVVVEPARIVAESPQGLRALYVSLTRSTKRLTVLHAEELPAALAPAPDTLF